MEQGYNIFFTISILLEGIASNAFSIVPTTGCKQAMNNHGMVFKARPDQSFVAAEYFINDWDIASNIRPVTMIEKFSFLIKLNDNRFLSKVDFQNSGDTNKVGRKIYYFSNLDSSNAIDGNLSGNTMVLSKNALVSSADLSSAIPGSMQFPVDATKYTEIQLFQIIPTQANKQLPSVYISTMPQAVFLLGNNVPGAYQFNWVGTPARTETVYADNSLVADDFFALVEIFKNTQANNDILNDNTIQYIIPFKGA